MTLERTAHVLDLSEDTVKNAFQYWERQGIVRRISDNPIAYPDDETLARCESFVNLPDETNKLIHMQRMAMVM